MDGCPEAVESLVVDAVAALLVGLFENWTVGLFVEVQVGCTVGGKFVTFPEFCAVGLEIEP